ncbi:MAG: hypothetical protein Q9191_006994 [Dirinaria sp. TL-2023a]
MNTSSQRLQIIAEPTPNPDQVNAAESNSNYQKPYTASSVIDFNNPRYPLYLTTDNRDGFSYYDNNNREGYQNSNRSGYEYQNNNRGGYDYQNNRDGYQYDNNRPSYQGGQRDPQNQNRFQEQKAYNVTVLDDIEELITEKHPINNEEQEEYHDEKEENLKSERETNDEFSQYSDE